jgi:Heterokaryon incompatibility protein Het-C
MGPASLGSVTDALSRVPGTDSFIQQARDLQAESDVQLQQMRVTEKPSGTSFVPPGSSSSAATSISIGGVDLDPATAVKKIYPILEFQ